MSHHVSTAKTTERACRSRALQALLAWDREPGAGSAVHCTQGKLGHGADWDILLPAGRARPAGKTPACWAAIASPAPDPTGVPAERVVDKPADGAIFLDMAGRQLQLCPAMRILLYGTRPPPTGIREVGDALKARFFHGEIVSRELDFLARPTMEHRSIEAVAPGGVQVFRITTGPVLEAGGGLAGRIQVYHDITPVTEEPGEMVLMLRAGLEVVKAPDLGSVLNGLGSLLSPQLAVDWMWLYVPGATGWEMAASWTRPGQPRARWVGTFGDAPREPSILTGVSRGELAAAGPAWWARMPLMHRGDLTGYWCLGSQHEDARAGGRAQLLEPVAAFLGCAVNASAAHLRADGMYQAMVDALAAMVDARDRYTMHHSRNVSRYAAAIARVMGLPPGEIRKLTHAGLVHDIGKVGIPDRILQKPGRLDASERAVMITHPAAGAAILERSGALRELAVLVRHHHEWHGGGGYPGGLAGDDIPSGCAILAVADAFDTMTSYRVYRPARSLDRAMAELGRCSGEQFHPVVAEALVEAIRRARERGEPWVAELEDRPDVLPPGAGAIDRALAQSGTDATTPKELTVLLRLAEELVTLGSLDELGVHALKVMGDELGYHHAGILLMNRRAQELVLVASAGKFGTAGRSVPRGTLVWSVMEHGRAEGVPDVTKDSRCRLPVWTQGSQVCVPVAARGKRLGVLVVAKNQAAAFHPGEVRLLAAVGVHLAGAITMMQSSPALTLGASALQVAAVEAEAAGAPDIG